MENEIIQTPTSIIQTFINGNWKKEIIQTIDEDGRVHIIKKVSNGTEIKGETKIVV